jgi:F-type H+-transporting ATPase subunit b
MNMLLLEAAGGGAAEMIHNTARTFGVDGPHLVAQMVSFAIVAFLLHRFAYRPILQVLEDRKLRIAESLANAEKIKAELAQAEASRQEIIQRAGVQANQLIAEARVAAAQVQEAETRKAIATAEQIIAKAREAAIQDHGRMMAELKQEIGRLVVETTAKVSGKILTAEDQQRLIQETTRELAA